MKRLISILSAACILFSLGTAAWAEEPETLVIDATTPVGFYDSSGAEPQKLETGYAGSAKTVYLRHPNEWSKYDITSLSGGTYELRIDAILRAKTYCDILIDSQLVHKATLAANGTLNDNPKTVNIGDIYIAPGSQFLTVKNGLYNNLIALQKIVLTKKSDANTTDGVMKFNGRNVALGGKSGAVTVNYFDNGSVGNYNDFAKFGSGTDGVTLHARDWAEYDVSGVPAGIYAVVVNAALKTANTTTTYKLSAGTVANPATRIALASGTVTAAATATNYDVWADSEIGEMYIAEGDELLRVENVGAAATFMEYFTLIPVPMVAYTDLQGTVIKEIGNNSDIKAKISAYIDKTCDLIVVHALYNDESLEKILLLEEVTNVEEGTIFERNDALTGAEAGKTVKTMVWKVDDLNPLGAAGKIS